MRSAQEQEFRRFAGDCLPWLTRMATALAGDPHRGDDLVQDALVKAFVHWRKVSRADDPRAYLRRILVRCSIDAGRSAGRRREVAAPDSDGSTSRRSPMVDDESRSLGDRDELRSALARLGARQRQVVVLRFVEDLDVATTAALLGITEGTVKSTTHQALAALRAGLAEIREQEVTR